jgi:isopenicillin N synthase-like dioxygenase
VHCVRNKTGNERYSLPFFLGPDPGADLDVLKCCLAKDEKPKFEKISIGDLYIQRVLPARAKHPTSIKFRNVPQEEWSYNMLLS